MSEDPGYVLVRRDACGPFVQIRYGLDVLVSVRLEVWAGFVDAVCGGRYVPQRLPERRGWVRCTLDERWEVPSDARLVVTPVGWRPKVFEVPMKVWKRFEGAARSEAFAGLGVEWTGGPETGGGQPSSSEQPEAT
ncbi:hypothetical protein AB0C27_06450 [Nonomuraea sp. NPDC048882]|uniref:hypothetical protein n=1 Tax=Nonomuraea sp. NPDC048882 TaxID=3154347 RepID=UPI0033FE3E81